MEVFIIYGRLLLPVPTAALAAELTDTLRQGLTELQRQLAGDIRRVQRDWYEQATPPNQAA